MASSTQTETTRFSVKSFGIGLGIAALVYAALFAIASSQQESSQKALQSRLASLTVLVDNKGQLQFTIKPQSEDNNTHEQTHQETEEHPHDNTVAHSEAVEHPEANTHEEHVDNGGEQAEENLSLEDVVSQQSIALREAPVEGFYEVSSLGNLPVAKSPTQTPFLIYSKPFVLNKTKPYVAVVMADFGLSDTASRDMIERLPSTVTFILSPYSAKPEEWTKRARADGHEVWLGLPLENKNFPLEDPGAKGLLTRVSLQYNQERLEWVLSRANGYAGIASYSDPALASARNVFEKMMRSVLDRGLGYFEINTGNDSFVLPLAETANAPQAHNNGTIQILDEDSADVKRIYSALERDGHAVALVEPSPANLKAMEGWLTALEADGIGVVPLSAAAAPDTERN